MPFKNAPKGGRGKPRAVWFSYLKELRGGKQFTGYVAGATSWLEVHQSERTQPCLDLLTEGELKCLHCPQGSEVVTRGAFPFYLYPSNKASFVWVSDDIRDVIDALTLHTKVTIGRDLGKGQPAWVTRCLNQEPAFTSSKPEHQRSADITPSLLKIFRMPELVNWYYCTRGGSIPTASAPKEDEPVKTWNRFVELGSFGKLSGSVAPEKPDQEQPADNSEEEQAFLRAVQEGRATSKNGKHVKRPKRE